MINLADIQGIIRSGYNHQPFARFLFLQIDGVDAARAWLRQIIPEIMTAEHWSKEKQDAAKPESSAHLSLTCPGLAKLGLSDEALKTFPLEFREGMANGNRSLALGDIGANDPKLWEVGGPDTPEVHVLLLLYAVSAERLDLLTGKLWHPADQAGSLTEVFRQESFRPTSNEPFGFQDGVSQPAVEGISHRLLPGQDLIKTGDFLLGYENEYNQLSAAPTIAASDDPHNLLPDADGRKEFGRNGSFLVWRKLWQDVDGFWKFLDEQTKNPDGTSNPEIQQYLGAKLIGRWPSGAPLALAPEKDDPALGADKQRNNNFLFMPNDQYGYRCPVGSHMRRANPRDTLKPNPKESVAITRRHRIIRRGRPFGLAVPGGQAGAEQGTIFITLQANLERQFEFIQQTWLYSPKFQGLYRNADPLVGNLDGGGTMDIQSSPVRKQLQGLPQFVTVKGGGYFFLPSLRALRFLAEENAGA